MLRLPSFFNSPEGLALCLSLQDAHNQEHPLLETLISFLFEPPQNAKSMPGILLREFPGEHAQPFNQHRCPGFPEHLVLGVDLLRMLHELVEGVFCELVAPMLGYS